MDQDEFPIWSADGASIIEDENCREIWLDVIDIRRLIGRQQLGVMREGRVRKIVLKVPQETAFPRSVRRLPPAQPNCIRVAVGDSGHAYMHVARRCASYYDGRPLPEGVQSSINYQCL